LCHMTLNLAETSVVKSRPSVLYGANLFVDTVTVGFPKSTSRLD